MEKIKVIKGTPIYVYRASMSLEPIPKLIVKEMAYDDEKNITYVRLKRRTVWTELICSILIICCVTLAIMNYGGMSIECNYNSLVNYYDNKLFLNWKNPSENSFDITFELLDNDEVIYKEVLKPGESITYIDLDSPKSKYKCEISSKVFSKTVSDIVTLTVINRETQ